MSMMKTYSAAVLVTILTLCASVPLTPVTTRIIAGQPAPRIPWMTSIQYSDGFHFCGGNLLSANLMLTAAHCFYDLNQTFAKTLLITANRINISKSALEEGGVDFDVVSYEIHPGFAPPTLMNDLCLVKLSPRRYTIQNIPLLQYVQLDDSNAGMSQQSVQRGLFSPYNSTEHAVYEGVDVGNPGNVNLFVAGWGKTNVRDQDGSAILMRAPMLLSTIADCAELEDLSGMDTNSVVCGLGQTFQQDSCQGDSGGPLYNDNGKTQTLVGVVSYGIGCAQLFHPWFAPSKEIPGVYTRVYYFRDFLLNALAASAPPLQIS